MWDCEDKKRLMSDGFVARRSRTVTENRLPRREMICCLVSTSTCCRVSCAPGFAGTAAGVFEDLDCWLGVVGDGEFLVAVVAAAAAKDLTLPPFWTLNQPIGDWDRGGAGGRDWCALPRPTGATLGLPGPDFACSSTVAPVAA